jgi:5-methylcytosine-specific restriction enzyme subunit McrC
MSPSSARFLGLTEEEPLSLPEAEFDERTALLIHTRYRTQIEIQTPAPWNGRRYQLSSRGWVGQLPVSPDLILQVSPKVPVGNVFRMLEYAYDLKQFELLQGTGEAGSLQEIFESLASILAHRVLKRTQQGLYRGYIRREESLPFLRGRVRPAPSLKSSLGGDTRLVCSYDENTADADDNRILAWTLHQLSRTPMHREDVKARIRRAYRALAQAVEVERKGPQDCVHRFYDRLNDDYRPMHALCRLFLERCGPDIQAEGQEFVPFMLHMPRLYERFVERWVGENLPPHLHLQGQCTVGIEEGGPMRFQIDLVLTDRRTGDTVAVLDVKYKRPDSPSEGDIQQVVAYAVRMGARRAFLVYPAVQLRPRHYALRDVVVDTLSFRTDQTPDEAGRAFLCDLLDKIGRA